MGGGACKVESSDFKSPEVGISTCKGKPLNVEFTEGLIPM